MINTYKPEGLLLGTAKNREYLSMGKIGLERAMAQGIILEGTALLCDENMNLHVELLGIKGIIPKSEVCFQMSGDEVKDIAIISRVGKPVCFKVCEIFEKEGVTFAILSRREAQRECMFNYVADLIPGDVICSRVTHLDSFGAFVDIGCGLISLMSVDCISVSRFSHPRDRVYPGMIIQTVIKSINYEKGRVFVSMRELLGTWEENAALFSPGQTVAGIIRSVESYGVFVELMPNLAGLAELKEGILDFFGTDCIGKNAAVYIKSIIPERMKIKLVLIDIYKDEISYPKLKYFIDCDSVKHIDRWRYSPLSCTRLIETDFTVC